MLRILTDGMVTDIAAGSAWWWALEQNGAVFHMAVTAKGEVTSGYNREGRKLLRFTYFSEKRARCANRGVHVVTTASAMEAAFPTDDPEAMESFAADTPVVIQYNSPSGIVAADRSVKGRSDIGLILGMLFIAQHREKATFHRIAHAYRQAASWDAVRPGPEVD